MIIYEKHFPRIDYEELRRQKNAGQQEPEETAEEAQKRIAFFDSIKQELSERENAIPENEMLELGNIYIQTAIDLSNEYEISISIKVEYNHLSISFYNDCGMYLRHFTQTFGNLLYCADGFDILTNREKTGYDYVITIEYDLLEEL